MKQKIIDLITILENEPKIYSFIRQCPYEILRELEVKEYEAGEFILNQGEVYDKFYIIVEGILDIIVDSEYGKKYNLTTYSKGDTIGELEIFKRYPYVSRVESKTKVKLIVATRQLFLDWIQKDRIFNMHMIESISNQSYSMCHRMGNNTLYTLKRRVNQFLLDNIKYQKSNMAYEVEITSEMIAEKMAVTKRSVNRILQNLKQKNIIEVSKNSIRVTDIDALVDEINTK